MRCIVAPQKRLDVDTYATSVGFAERQMEPWANKTRRHSARSAVVLALLFAVRLALRDFSLVKLFWLKKNGNIMEKLFDSHAHYYDARFESELGGADALLCSLFEGEVGGIVNVGTDLENMHTVVNAASRYEKMYAAVGIHPSDGQAYRDIDAAVATLRAFLADAESRRARKIVALGEIGLDYHYEDTDKAHQLAMFEAQLSLAEELDMPVIVHDREAHGDCFDAICRHPRVRGVFHSYSGSAEMACDLVRRGWYLSFSGVVTFKNAPRVREAVAAVPLDRLLIETDCPYLTPHPHRGKLNHSGYMRYTAEAVAEVKGIDVDSLIRASADAAKTLFCIA